MRLMKSVARRVALNLSEAKRFTTLNELPIPPVPASVTFRWAYKNVFAPIPSGNGAAAGTSWAVEGNEIVDPLVKMKITFRLNFSNQIAGLLNGAYTTNYMWVYLIASNEQVTGLLPPSNTWTNYPVQYASDDPGWFLTQNPQRPTLNGNNVKILRRWSRKYTPDELFAIADATSTLNVQGLGRPQINMNCKHRFRGKKTFEDAVFGDTDSNFLRSAILRGWNFYWLVGWGIGPTAEFSPIPTTNQPSVSCDTYTYFKDP